MTIQIKFNDGLFEGFMVAYKMNDNISKTLIISETYARLDGVLDSLNLQTLRCVLKDQSFIIQQSLEDIKDGDSILISSLKAS